MTTNHTTHNPSMASRGRGRGRGRGRPRAIDNVPPSRSREQLAFQQTPQSFRLGSGVTVNRRGRLASATSLANTARASALRAVSTAARSVVSPAAAARWNDAGNSNLVQLVRDDARDWTVATTTERAARLSAFDRVDYRNAFPTVRLDRVNIHYIDITPQRLQAYLARYNGSSVNPNDPHVAGEVQTNADGDPFIVWEKLCAVAARVVYAALDTYGFPTGSFWQVQIINHFGDTISGSINFDTPTLARVKAVICELENGESSGGDMSNIFQQGAYFRAMVYNPATGRGGGHMPPHLKGHTKVCWSPSGDEHCALKSILVCLAENKYERKNLKTRSSTMANKIDAHLSLPGMPQHPAWSFMDIEKAATILNIGVTILDAYTTAILYEANVHSERKEIFLFYDQRERHYLACFNPASIHFSHKKYCPICRKLYYKNRIHVCQKYKCDNCHRGFDTEQLRKNHQVCTKWVTCQTCNREMPPQCLPAHAKSCNGRLMTCPKCGEVYANKLKCPPSQKNAITKEQHDAICGLGYKYCIVCESHQPSPHTCTITRRDYSHNWDRGFGLTYVYDLEACRDPENMGEQIVTLVSVRCVLEPSEGESADDYVLRHKTFHESNPPLHFYDLADFCQWLVTLKNATVIAHNMSGYDGVLVHNHMRYVLHEKTKPIFAGLKIMMFTWRCNRMIDSLKHMSSTLAGLPKLLGIKIPCAKDHFPHKFNVKANREYAGSLPSADMYELDKSTESPESFHKWHLEEAAKYTPHTNKLWVLKEVEKTYCDQDTYVLAICIGEYRRMQLEVNQVDPLRFTTIASTCLAIYRTHHIPHEGILTLTHDQAEFCRRGLHGGRTETFASYYNGTIRGIDVQSMYPYVMYEYDMPYGSPTIHNAPNIPTDWINGCGFAEVDLTPPPFNPDKPYFKPLLGAMSDNGKYQFDLYPKKKEVVTLVELRKAVQIGYTIDKVHTTYHFEARNDLFKTYIATFLKIKVESSKPPQDPALCIAEHRRRYGIELDIVKLLEPENKGRRSLAKLALNNLWGKLAQRIMPQSELVTPEQFHTLMGKHHTGKIKLESVEVNEYLLDRYAMVYHDLARPANQTLTKTNVAIGAHVTAYARLELYKVLGDPNLPGPPLYCDTDCVWFVAPPGYTHPLEGNYLGEWEDETPGIQCDEFVALAPKLYAVRKQNSSFQKIRCKGFKMTNQGKERITFDSLHQSLREDDEGNYVPITVEYNHFTRVPMGSIFVGDLSKSFTYNPTTQKSKVVSGSHFMIPYGLHAPNPDITKPPATKRDKPSLPKPNYKKVRLDDEINNNEDNDDGNDFEMSEETSESLMAQTIAAQDASRTPHVIDLIPDY